MNRAGPPRGEGGSTWRRGGEAAAAWTALRGAILVALGAAMLMWTALANGRPAVFTDTALYYSQAEYLFEALGWIRPADAVAPTSDPTALPARPGAPSISASIDRARSPAYAAPVYLLQRLGGLWLAAFAQAFAAAATLYVLYRAACPGQPRAGYLLLTAGLAAFSPLPFFASWIMPDVWAGVMGCALLGLLVYADRLGGGRRALLAAMAAFAMAAHRSNLLDAAAVALVAVPLLRLGGTARASLAGRLAILALAGGAAALAAGALERPVERRAGEPIGSPPFLSARVLADGPGRAYLRRTCRGRAPFELCRFDDRVMATSDQVLWSIRRRTAVFLADDPSGRLRMEREDARFALDAALAEPWAEAGAAAANVGRQFVEVDVDDPVKDQRYYLADGYWRRTSLPRILPGAAACRRACAPLAGRGVADALDSLGLLASLGYLGWRLTRRDVRGLLRRGESHPELTRPLIALALVLTMLLANAAVCGALSGPFPRYQARLIWLLPLAAGLLAMGEGRRRGLTPSGPADRC